MGNKNLAFQNGRIMVIQEKKHMSKYFKFWCGGSSQGPRQVVNPLVLLLMSLFLWVPSTKLIQEIRNCDAPSSNTKVLKLWACAIKEPSSIPLCQFISLKISSDNNTNCVKKKKRWSVSLTCIKVTIPLVGQAKPDGGIRDGRQRYWQTFLWQRLCSTRMSGGLAHFTALCHLSVLVHSLSLALEVAT